MQFTKLINYVYFLIQIILKLGFLILGASLLFLYNNIIIVDVTITPMLKVIKNILLSDNVFFIFSKKNSHPLSIITI